MLFYVKIYGVGGKETIDYEESEDATGGVLAPVC